MKNKNSILNNYVNEIIDLILKGLHKNENDRSIIKKIKSIEESIDEKDKDFVFSEVYIRFTQYNSINERTEKEIIADIKNNKKEIKMAYEKHVLYEYLEYENKIYRTRLKPFSFSEIKKIKKEYPDCEFISLRKPPEIFPPHLLFEQKKENFNFDLEELEKLEELELLESLKKFVNLENLENLENIEDLKKIKELYWLSYNTFFCEQRLEINKAFDQKMISAEIKEDLLFQLKRIDLYTQHKCNPVISWILVERIKEYLLRAKFAKLEKHTMTGLKIDVKNKQAREYLRLEKEEWSEKAFNLYDSLLKKGECHNTAMKTVNSTILDEYWEENKRKTKRADRPRRTRKSKTRSKSWVRSLLVWYYRKNKIPHKHFNK